MITIFTSTYNRGSLLPDLYETLIKQTYKDFEWIIIDDGSSDKTEEVVMGFKKENLLNITFLKQTNSGKHVAVNRGVLLARGEYFFIVDSDDKLPSDSLEIICKWMNSIKDNDKFIGVGGIKAYFNKSHVGKTFKGEYLDCTSAQREKNNIYGDKAEVFKTNILKKYQFPVHKGENFVAESTIWNKISYDGYLLRWFNEIIYLCEYRSDGLSNDRGKFYKNYLGFIDAVKIELKIKDIKFRSKIKKLIICCVYAKKKRYGYKKLAKELDISSFLVFLLAEFGNVFYKLFGGSVN